MIKRIIARGFFKGLREKVGKEKAQEIYNHYLHVLKENQHWVTDQPTELNIVYTSMSLAAFQVLKKDCNENWKEILRYCLMDRTKKKQQFFMKLYLKFDRHPFKRIVKISKAKQVKAYGEEHFDFSIKKDDNQSFHLHVNQCFYLNFFQSHDAVEIMPLFCAMDDIWGDLLVPDKHGVEFTRPQLLSKGDSHCFFKFERTD